MWQCIVGRWTPVHMAVVFPPESQNRFQSTYLINITLALKFEPSAPPAFFDCSMELLSRKSRVWSSVDEEINQHPRKNCKHKSFPLILNSDMDGTSPSSPTTLDLFWGILVLCLVRTRKCFLSQINSKRCEHAVEKCLGRPFLQHLMWIVVLHFFKANYLSPCFSFSKLLWLPRGDHSLVEHWHGLFYLMLVSRPKSPSIYWLLTHWCWLHLVSTILCSDHPCS